MQIGIVAGSMKPIHKGHWHLIKRAAEECDKVMLFVSTTDRKKKGEFPIYGEDMVRVWEEHLTFLLPQNVELVLCHVPIRSVYEYLGAADKVGGEDHFAIYSDPKDTRSRFQDDKVEKYMPYLWEKRLVHFRLIEREGDLDVSGTQMREYLKHGMMGSFIDCLPDGVDGQEIWHMLGGVKVIRLEGELQRADTMNGRSRAEVLRRINERLMKELEEFKK